MARVSFLVALALLAATIGIGAFRSGAAGIQIGYVPIDPHVFVSRATAAGWASTHDQKDIDAHAIALWNGLTALTNEKVASVPLAVFSTWYTPCDVYPIKKKCNHAIVHGPTELEVPQQFFRTPRISSLNLFSGVKYNKQMVDFIVAGYRGSTYVDGSGLVKAIGDGKKNLADSSAPSAMMTKPVYQLISGTRPTIVGYWQGPGLTVPLGASTSPLTPDVDTWLKIAVIDPTGKATNDKAVAFCADTLDPTGAVVGHRRYIAPAGSYPIVPLSEMYAFPMSVADQARFAQMREDFRRDQIERLVTTVGPRALKQDPGCPQLAPVNPMLAFVGMHVVTAEYFNTWSWQTFWWTPNAKPMPGAAGPFKHFDFATSYWTIDKAPHTYHVAFNPYLEAGFGTATFTTPAWTSFGAGSVPNLGRTTECISCHSAATYTVDPKPKPSPGYVAHGNQPQLPMTSQSILTRNLWSLAIRASHPSTP